MSGMIRRRRRERRCSWCGIRLRRIKGLIYREDYDRQTGRKAWVWYWGCPQGFFGWHRSFLDGRPFHDAWRIPASPARRRLERAA